MEGNIKKWEPINFVFYLSFVKWPVLAAILVEIVLRLLIGRFLDDWPLGRVDLLMWIVRLALFIYVGWRIGKTYGEVPPIGALAGSAAGFLAGIALTLFRFYSGFRAWKVFNIVSETALLMLVGALTAFLVVYLWELWPKKFKN
jgi:hypothetical protein